MWSREQKPQKNNLGKEISPISRKRTLQISSEEEVGEKKKKGLHGKRGRWRQTGLHLQECFLAEESGEGERVPS